MSEQGNIKEKLMSFKCPYCSHEGPPRINKKISMGGWVLFVVLVLFCLLLCWIPFVVDGCKEEERICSNCGTKLA